MQRYFFQKSEKIIQNSSLRKSILQRVQILNPPQSQLSQNHNRGMVTKVVKLENLQQQSFIRQSLAWFAQKQQERYSNIFFNKKENEEQKVPKGFEKFLKRTSSDKKGQDVKEEDKKKDVDSKKSSEKEASKAKDEEEAMSDDESDKKKDKKFQSKEADEGSNPIGKFFFDPNNGQPRFENILLLVLLGGAFTYYMFSNAPSEEVTYMDFVNQYLSKNLVKMITISEDKTSDMFKYKADIETIDQKRVHLVLPQVENFLYKLDLAQREMGKVPSDFVPVKYASEANMNNNQALHYLIGGLFALALVQLYRSMHGKGGSTGTGKTGGSGSGSGPLGGKGPGGIGDIFGMGKSNVQVYGVDKKIKTRFKHVAGMETAKQEITEFVDFLKDPKKYQKLGAKIPRGALLVGPPGTGKTLLAKAVAGEAGVPFFSISGSDFVEMFVGVGASRVRDLFKKARDKAPSIIFIDEIDAVAKKRHGKFGGNDERDNTLNQLLVEMDGFGTDESVIILAATNRSDILDPAVLRPGRFDRQVEITLPTIKDRTEIFKVHLKKIKLNADKSREEYARKMAALTPGFSGADISNVCNEGAIIAARTNLDSVGITQFESAVERVIGGMEKKTLMTLDEKKVIAYHEAGHAVAGWFLEHSNPLLKVTIIPRSKGSLGFAQYLPDEISLYTREQLYDMISVSLGGRIAEQLFFGRVTTGASDDIKKVTQIAQGLVQTYGMSERLGLINYHDQESNIKPYSEETNEIIDEEIRRVVEECYARTKEILESKRELIHNLAERLLEKESINLPDIIKVLGQRPFPMKESVKEYLQEMTEREEKAKEEEESKKDETKEQEKKTEVDAAETPLSKSSNEKEQK